MGAPREDTADVRAVDAGLHAAGRDTRAGHWPNGGRFTSADAYLPIDTTPVTLTILADTLVADVVVRHGSATEVRLSDGWRIEAARLVVCAGVSGRRRY